MSEEELKKAIEELPEEGAELGEQAPPTEQTQQPPEQPPPPPKQPPQTSISILDEYRRRAEEFKKNWEQFKETLQMVREISSYPPEQVDTAMRVIRELMPKEEKPKTEAPPKVETKVVTVPVEKTVEKPIPIVPEELKSKIENVEEAVNVIDYKISQYDKILDRLTALSTTTLNLTEKLEEMRSEIDRIRRESEEREKQLREQFMVVPKTKFQRPDGTVVEEYDYHPALKATEKQTEFAYSVMGPAVLAELRQTRSEISSTLNRIMSLMEAILTPELRKRAPKLVEDVEERFKRLVGGLPPEEREKELGELEKKLEDLGKLKAEKKG
jgi:uncharacterized coiled-coil DUF342 family protein